MADELPGMAPPERHGSRIEAAAQRQIDALREANLLDDSHAIIVALIEDLAAVIGSATGRGRASAVALASKEIREAIALLPKAPGPGDPFTGLMQDLAAADAEARERANRYLNKP